MSAKLKPAVKDRPVILPIRRDPAPPRRIPSTGYTRVPNHVTEMVALPPGGAHRVLTALIHLCYGRTPHTKASIATISKASNTPAPKRAASHGCAYPAAIDHSATRPQPGRRPLDHPYFV